MFDFRRRVTTRPRRPVPRPHPGDPRAWAVDRWARLDRFLALGGTTHRAGERATARALARALDAPDADVSAVLGCLAADGARVVRRVVEVAASGHAASDDPTLLALALAADAGDAATREAAHAALPDVARTGAHLFRWLRWRRTLPGWGSGLAARDPVARWYASRAAHELAHQMMRWPSRDGWTHADALRLARPDAPTAAHALLYRWALRGWPGVLELRGAVDADLVERLEAAQALHEMAPGAAARVISVYRLAEAMVPARLLRHLAVWEALLDVMPLSALVRRLGAMTRAGLLAPGGASTATRLVAGRLRDHEAVHGARISPLALLDARAAYTRGAAAGAWVPVPEVVDALDTAFALALENAPATGKRVLLAIDASAAMAAPARGLRRLSCREAAAATALATAAAEPECRVVALATGPGPIELAVSPRHRLDAVVVATEGAAPAGAGTDCALPMTVALERGWAVDAFVVLTAHGACGRGRAPAQALRAYRRRTGIAARLAVVAMASGGVGTADPDDAGMLDVVGFRPETPRVIADFARGP